MMWDRDKDDDHPGGHMEVHPYGELHFGDPNPPAATNTPANVTPGPPPPPAPTPGPIRYTVKLGDNLSKLAEGIYGVQKWPWLLLSQPARLSETPTSSILARNLYSHPEKKQRSREGARTRANGCKSNNMKARWLQRYRVTLPRCTLPGRMTIWVTHSRERAVGSVVLLAQSLLIDPSETKASASGSS